MERSRVQAVAGVIVIITCLAAIFYHYSRPVKNGFGSEHDFVTVIAGSHCILDRCDPYDSPTLEREFQKMGGYTPSMPFKPEWPVYPPSALLFLLPLALLPWPVLSVVWMLLCFGFTATAFVVVFLRCKAYRDLLSLAPFIILLADGSIGWAVELGQPALIAAASLAMALPAIESSLPILGTLLLTVSLLIKPQFAYLCVAYFLLKRTTRLPALAAGVLTGLMGAAGTLVIYARLHSMAYLAHLSANLKLAVRPGGDADFSLRNAADSASYLNLQAFLARFLADRALCNQITYAVCAVIVALLVFVVWRTQSLHRRPNTILAALVALELLATYHRLYDHLLILAAIYGFYEIRERSRSAYLLLLAGLFVYHFSQFHGLKIHGLGPFSSGPPVEMLICGVCLWSLWRAERPVESP